MHLLVQDLVNGILAGGILAVVALGFSLVWGIMNIINLAHGAFIMLGAYLTYELFVNFHLDPFLTLPLAFIVMFGLGYLIQRYLINWVARAPILTTFLLTFGLSLLFVNIALIVWTGDQRGVTTSYSGANFSLAGITIPWAKFAPGARSARRRWTSARHSSPACAWRRSTRSSTVWAPGSPAWPGT
jgi:branched-chain amino acid transport system permease protein